jgi:hypothetical protein
VLLYGQQRPQLRGGDAMTAATAVGLDPQHAQGFGGIVDGGQQVGRDGDRVLDDGRSLTGLRA